MERKNSLILRQIRDSRLSYNELTKTLFFDERNFEVINRKNNVLVNRFKFEMSSSYQGCDAAVRVMIFGAALILME